jgi:hypothetical protein
MKTTTEGRRQEKDEMQSIDQEKAKDGGYVYMLYGWCVEKGLLGLMKGDKGE